MADISKVTLPSGSVYNIKDEYARQQIEAMAGFTKFLGVTTSNISDGSTLNPIVIGGQSVTADTGSVVTKGSKEFIWNGSAWQEFGDMSGLKALAFKDSASGPFTPAGSVSQPTFTGNELSSSGSFKPSGSVTISTGTGTANYTPAGSVSKPTFTGSSSTFNGSFTPQGSVTITKGTGTANYTPEGSVSLTTTSTAPTISSAAGTSSNNTFRCAGTVSTPTITVTPSTTTVNSITDVGSLPAFTATVANENLTLGWDAGSLPTKGDNTTVATGISSATSTQPSFSGSYFKLTNSSINLPTSASFSGTGAELKGSFSGTQGSVSVTGTPNGDVSQPEFTGTGAHLNGSFTGTSATVTVKGTPSGTVSKPTFTGTEGTVTVS